MRKKTKFKQTEIGMIPENWNIPDLKEVLVLLKDGSHNPPKRVAAGVKFIAGASDLKYRNIDFSTCTYISDEEYKKMHRYYSIEPNDILLTIVGTIGNVGIVKKSDLPFSLQRSIAILRPDKSLFFGFLFYWLTSPQFKQLLESRLNTTAQPGIYLTELGKLQIPLPPLLEQRSIAKILSDLDDKIELNQQMNKTLEAIGQAIFKHWFVDFEFPNEQGKPYKSSGGKMIDSELGKIPEGWVLKPIDEIADFLNGLALQKYPAENGKEFLPVIKIRELKQGITESSDKASMNIPEEYVVHDGDVLFSWSGSLEVVLWTFGKGALNQHLFKVSSKQYPKWFYYCWVLRYLPEYKAIAEGKATTMGHIQRHHLRSSLVLVPDKELLVRADKILSSILDEIVSVNITSRNLAQIRDSLLPKLMSGKIRVPVEVRT